MPPKLHTPLAAPADTLAALVAEVRDLVATLRERSSLEPVVLDRRAAASLCGVAASTWDRLTAEGLNPDPIRITSAPAWRTAELRAWVEAGCPPRGEWEALKRRARAG